MISKGKTLSGATDKACALKLATRSDVFVTRGGWQMGARLPRVGCDYVTLSFRFSWRGAERPVNAIRSCSGIEPDPDQKPERLINWLH